MAKVFQLLAGRRAQGALLIAFGVALIFASPAGAAMVAPAFVLATAVWLGAFTGERPIAWVRRVVRRLRPRRVLVLRSPRPHAPLRVVPFGTTLPFALAMRPPPRSQR